MKIAVCEDVAVEAEWLRREIQKWFFENKRDAQVLVFENAQSFWFALEDTAFDALFLDIKMPGEDGVSLAKKLRRQGNQMPIVFVTGEKEYMQEGYEVEAVHYLLKPVAEEKIGQCLQRICQREQHTEAVLLSAESGAVRLPVRDIYLIEVFSHSVQYVTKRGDFRVAQSFGKALAALDTAHFVTCYRGIAVHLRYVSSIGKNHLCLQDEETHFEREIPVSRRLYAAVNQAFIRYYTEG